MHKIRIKTEEYVTLVSREDGSPLEDVTRASILVTPTKTLATLTHLCPEVDVVAEVVDLERLVAAEEVCQRVRTFFKHSTVEVLPGTPEWGLRRALGEALTAWEERLT